MIVIGVAPGLRALTYSVIGTSPDGDPPELLDQDVLLGPKLDKGAAGAISALADLVKKAYSHHLVLEVVLERALVPIRRGFGMVSPPRQPAALIIGPPCNPKEPPEHVEAVSIMLQTIATRFALPAHRLGTAAIQKALAPSKNETWLRYCNRTLWAPLPTKDPKVILSVTAALAGIVRYGRDLS